MAARFWVTGGTGNWNSTTNWSATTGGASGASVPSTADTATFNGSSGSGTATLDISPNIQTLTMTGFTGTLAFGTNTISLNSTGTVFTGATTMTVTGTPQIICTDSSATSRSISPAAVTEANSISFRITAGTGTFTISTAQNVRDLDFTDGTNPTGYGGAFQGGVNNVYGNFKASTNMTQGAFNNALTFLATSGTKTITTAGVTFDRPFTFNGVGGTWQLQDALTIGSTRAVSLTNGTLDLNNYTLTSGSFNSTVATARTLAFGTGKMVISGNGGSMCQTSTGTNLTITGSKRVEFSYSGSTGTRTILGATNATVIEGTNLLDYFIIDGLDIVTFSGARNYGTIDFSSGATTFTGTWQNATNNVNVYGNLILNSTMVVGSGGEVVSMRATSGTKTITSAGQTMDFLLTINGLGGTFACSDALTLGSTRTLTLTSGTLDLNNYTLTSGSFSSNNSNIRTLAFGTSNITLTNLNTTIWSAATATNFSYTGTPTVNVNGAGTGGQTRTISHGSTAGGTEANAPSFNISAGADGITTTGNSAIKNLNFTGFTGTLNANGRFIYGNLILSSGMTLTPVGVSTTTFAATSGTQQITTAGQTIDFPITFNGVGGTFAFQDALTLGSLRTLTFTNGTLQLKSGVTSTVGSFVTSGTTQKFLQSTLSGTQATISQASGTVAVTYLTIKDSNATGGAIWKANTDTNINNGNNTGWLFLNGNMFFMFN